MSRQIIGLIAMSFLLGPDIHLRCDASEDRRREASVPDFNRDVRPILADHCFACHGFDADARQADLRLDTFADATSDQDGPPAIRPGDIRGSELWLRINSEDRSERMPPTDSHEPLSDAQKETLRRWIESGAVYARHWAFEPLRKVVPPDVDGQWGFNPIDAFVAKRLRENELSPSPNAPSETLLRRATLDLTGLPPTPAEIARFLRDSFPQSYLKLVDRLIASPSHAERRAQDWLDLARYADSRGFADDKTRQIWPFRDWVIDAVGKDMPFDQFTIEQLAGDMLPDASTNQQIASAFHRNAPQAKGMTYPVEEYRIKGVIDRVNTTGRVWLGLTVGCAQCHDHKFDPIRQRDYYAMFGLLNQVEHGGTGFEQGGPTLRIRYLPPESSMRRNEILAHLNAARKNLPPSKLPTDDSLLGVWNGPAIVERSLDASIASDFTITAKLQTDQPVADIVSNYDWRDRQRGYVFGIGGEGDKNGSPGHLFAWVSAKTDPFDGVEIHGSHRIDDGETHDVAVVFRADQSIRLFVDGIEDVSVKVIGKVPSSVAKPDRSLVIGAGFNGSATPDAFQFSGSLRDVRIYRRALDDDEGIHPTDESVERWHRELLALEHRTKRHEVIEIPVMRESSKKRETFVHRRGNFLDRGEKVDAGIPAFLSDGDAPRDRLALARWLVDGDNPLVARVVVNRIWRSHFGRGLVATADDFGTQGAMPSHPELLDWLANELVESGWSRNRIHRLIVTSATYQQSSVVRPDAKAIDPDNRLLSYMPRPRLTAEQIRDQALAASGLLVRQRGGPPVFPVQPEGYWQQRALPGQWKTSAGAGRFRRTIYTYWRRMALHPSLELLDAPARETCVGQRQTSNVPTQALVTFNDPMFWETAVAMASRVMNSHSDDEGRIGHAFRLVVGRSPTAIERDRMTRFLIRERNDLSKDSAATESLLSGFDRRQQDAAELAAWALLCSTLLNLDETVTRP